jgi:hypothetical protein
MVVVRGRGVGGAYVIVKVVGGHDCAAADRVCYMGAIREHRRFS